MRIVNTINNILDAMVEDTNCDLASYQYNNLAKGNVRLDNKLPSPTALFIQITDFKLDISLITQKEKCSVFISFLDKEKKIDSEAVDQDVIIDNMTDIAVDFLQRLKDNGSIRILNDDIKLKSVFFQSDSNRSGVTIELELEERQGQCIPRPIEDEEEDDNNNQG